MNTAIGIALILCEIITGMIVIWMAYIFIRFIAERIVEPLFWKVNNAFLQIWVTGENEQWLMREEKKDDPGA